MSQGDTDTFDGGIRAEGDAKYEILLVHGGDEKHLPIQKSLLEKADSTILPWGISTSRSR